ncbi:MAG: hypothetical protein JW889_05740 [Verrucomicrobia bacterium]|nr:hypothetical protein [Verrucomicrobiota bacterium]
MTSVRDRFWIWGHEAGSHTTEEWGVPEPSRITPVEGAFYMGVPNVILVRYGGKPEPPYHQCAVPYRALRSVVWSIVGAGGKTDAADRAHVLDLARELPNMSGVMMDDFFHDKPGEKGFGMLSLDEVRALRRQLVLPDRQLDLWAVIYDRQLTLPLGEHLSLCDKVTQWFWRAAELEHLEQTFDQLEALAPQPAKLLGCYMFDYGERRPMPLDLLEYECETGLKWLREGRIEGMIFLATCICDLDLEAVEWTRRWIAKVGGEKL